MTPEEIIEAYDVLSSNLQDSAARESQIIGNSQRSIGGLAAAVASPSGQTSGLANYTYNRIMRPTINTLATNLETQGRAQALDRNLKNQLLAAKAAYEDAKNRYTVAASGGGNGNNGNTDTYKEKTVGSGDEPQASQIPYTAEGTVIGTGSTGNGLYDIIVADGKGGFTTHQYYGPSKEEALNKYYRDYGGSPSGSNGNGVSGGGGGGGGGGGW